MESDLLRLVGVRPYTLLRFVSVTPWVILNTELIVTLPRKAAQIFASQHKDLVIHDCPIKIDPIDIYLSWHERLNKSGPHLWLKELIVNSMY